MVRDNAEAEDSRGRYAALIMFSPAEPQSAKEVVGVALAGGASRRMGRDKARLRLGDTSLVECAARRLREVVSEVLVADRGLGLAPGYRSVGDGDGAGPAAGILGAAAVRPGRALLVLACDLPSVPAALLRRLTDPIEDDAFVPRWRRGLEPLCALYGTAALAALEAEARAGRFALHSLLRSESIEARYLEGRELAAFGPPEHLFLNLNTPEDLARLDATSACGSSSAEVD